MICTAATNIVPSLASLALLPLTLGPADANPGDTGPSSRDDETYAALCAAAAESAAMGGMVAVVDLAGETLFARGWDRLPGGGLAGPDAAFRAEPLFEPLVAVAGLQWAEQSGIALTAPLTSGVEGLTLGEDAPSLAQLLSHTSGLPLWSELPTADDAVDRTALEHAAAVVAQGPMWDPGSCFGHSESEALLLGVLMGGGEALKARMERGIFGPLGLEGTAFGTELDERTDARRAQEVAGRMRQTAFSGSLLGLDGLATTASDLTRIARGMAGDELLEPRYGRVMLEPRHLSDGTPTGTGLGVSLVALGDLDGVCFGGTADGVTFHVAHYAAADLTITCVAGAEAARLRGLAGDLARVALGLPIEDARAVPLSSAEAARCVGNYQLGCTTLEVKRDGDNGLLLSEAGAGTRNLLHRGAAWFFDADDDGFAARFVTPEGEEHATVLVLYDHGRYAEAVRVK